MIGRLIERMFVLIYILYGCLVLFLVGVYFDWGDWLVRHARDRGLIEGGLERIDHRQSGEEVAASSRLDIESGARHTGPGRWVSYDVDEAAYYRGEIFTMSAQEHANLRREQLERMGHVDPELIEMEMQAVERTTVDRISRKISSMIEEGLFEESAQEVLEAIQGLNSSNLLQISQLNDLLLRIRMAQAEIGLARVCAGNLRSIYSRILLIRRRDREAQGIAEPGPDEQEMEASLWQVDFFLQTLDSENSETPNPPDTKLTIQQAGLGRALEEGLIDRSALEHAPEAATP